MSKFLSLLDSKPLSFAFNPDRKCLSDAELVQLKRFGLFDKYESLDFHFFRNLKGNQYDLSPEDALIFKAYLMSSNLDPSDINAFRKQCDYFTTPYEDPWFYVYDYLKAMNGK